MSAANVAFAGPNTPAQSAAARGSLWFESSLERLVRTVNQHPSLSRVIATLPNAFGAGDSLLALYQNLFHLHGSMDDADGQPLTPREREIVLLAGSAQSHRQIAGRLGIAETTVRKHFSNVYRKLNVNRPGQAYRHALAAGYLGMDEAQIRLRSARTSASFGSALDEFCFTVGAGLPTLDGGEFGPLLRFGMFLMLVGAAAARQSHGDTSEADPGVVCLIDNGRTVILESGELMGRARGMSIAPPAAERQGFTPGNVFVVHDLVAQIGINRAAITEYTADGRLVRTFTGGRRVDCRLIGPLSLAFAHDGKLLATSGWLTRAILAFRSGGDRVDRLLDGHFIQAAASRNGRIVASARDQFHSAVSSTDPDGRQRERLCEMSSQEGMYDSVAVDSEGRTFVTVIKYGDDGGDREGIEALDSDGRLIGAFRVAGAGGGRLTMDDLDRLIVPCPRTMDVKFVDVTGRVVRRIDVAGSVSPYCAVEVGGRTWVCGAKPR